MKSRAARTAAGALLLAAALQLMETAVSLQSHQVNFPGTDLVLSRLAPRAFPVPFLTWGWVLLHPAYFLYMIRRRPGRLPFLLVCTALYAGIRDVFLALTPAAPPHDLVPLYAEGLLAAVMGPIAHDNELFFSGHTAAPTLYALMAWDLPRFRVGMLVLAALNGAGVLITHNHFAIDVLAAPFMAFAIHALARRLFGGWDETAGVRSPR